MDGGLFQLQEGQRLRARKLESNLSKLLSNTTRCVLSCHLFVATHDPYSGQFTPLQGHIIDLRVEIHSVGPSFQEPWDDLSLRRGG